MGEEIIAAVVMGLLEKTIAAAADRIGLVPGFKDELIKMEGLVRHIQDRVADAERRKSQDPIVLRWLKDFKGAILEAEIVLDELQYEGLRREVHKFKRGAVAKVCSFFSLFKHDVSFRVRTSYRVRAINAMLKGIKQQAHNLELALWEHDLLLLGRDSHVTVEEANRQTDSLPEQFVAGRSREESEIVDMLLSVSSGDNSPPVSVLAVVGMGGLGKTTLAKSIYNKGNIVNHFSKRCWVCVSNAKFEVPSILKGILESLKGGEKVEMSNRDDIVKGIQKELNGERFLFVLDDVWNEDSRLWDSFFTSLVGLNSANGSCCLLTTRLETTARHVSTSSPFDPFQLGTLSGDDCWLIIARRATPGGEMPEGFEVYKEEILKKCQGLPLAANVIGGLLSSQRKENWISIVEALKVREAVGGDIMPILKLSYDYLPHPHIKKCFVYCSVYSKNTEMRGKKLIELWMAQGYLQDDIKGGTTMEKHGAGCLTILVQSSLLAVNHGSYQMHDLVHDLAESISEREQFEEDYKHLQCRHLRLCEEELEENWNTKSKLAQTKKGGISNAMLLKYRYVRVLHLRSTEPKTLPSAIGKLKHVRCLHFSAIKIKTLPESLCTLYNLQTLRLKNDGDLQCLPQAFSNLISLRHLHFCSWNPKFKMPAKMGRLTNLQTLKFFNVGEDIGCGIEELGSMRMLEGSLKIRNLELVKGKEEAGMANLVEKKNLVNLTLEWGRDVDCNNRDDETVLEGLEPCPTLQGLRVANYMGGRLPRWLGKLSALVGLALDDCRELVGFDEGCAFPKPDLSSVPTHFPSLENLSISGGTQVSGVKSIISKSPSLKSLFIGGVDGMTSFSEVIESSLASSLSSLKQLHIFDCSFIDIPSSTLECFPKLISLQVERCTELMSCPLNLQRTPSLETIEFYRCPKLFITNDVPRGFNHLTNLKTLAIGPFSDESIQMFDWEGLKQGCSTTLQVLYLSGSPNSFFPEQLQHLSSLTTFELREFESLESLPDWIGNLTSLRELGLRDCPKLQHFLSSHAMERLNDLYRVNIWNCPLLRESTIPNLVISHDEYNFLY